MSKGTILIIDSDDDICNMFDIYLSGHGYQVYTVKTGKDAIMIINQILPNLIFLAVNLSDMSGYDLLHDLTAQETIEYALSVFIVELIQTNH